MATERFPEAISHLETVLTLAPGLADAPQLLLQARQALRTK